MEKKSTTLNDQLKWKRKWLQKLASMMVWWQTHFWWANSRALDILSLAWGTDLAWEMLATGLRDLGKNAFCMFPSAEIQIALKSAMVNPYIRLPLLKQTLEENSHHLHLWLHLWNVASTNEFLLKKIESYFRYTKPAKRSQSDRALRDGHSCTQWIFVEILI